jgi:hypothetical protein
MIKSKPRLKGGRPPHAERGRCRSTEPWSAAQCWGAGKYLANCHLTGGALTLVRDGINTGCRIGYCEGFI